MILVMNYKVHETAMYFKVHTSQNYSELKVAQQTVRILFRIVILYLCLTRRLYLENSAYCSNSVALGFILLAAYVTHAR
jgi:hypothetical protein